MKSFIRYLANCVIITLIMTLWAQPAPAQNTGNTGRTSACLSVDNPSFGGQVWIDGAEFVMGDDSGYAEEVPAHGVSVSGFWIDIHEVTNAQFAAFVKDTGYVTVAERMASAIALAGQELPDAMRQPGSVVFSPPAAGLPAGYWWRWVAGASWRRPEGPGSTIDGRETFPVVHVAYEDAAAYAEWAGRSLPTEAQFELVARNRRAGRYAWDGNSLAPGGHHHANTWQGEFPLQNSAADGFPGLAPVGCFGVNDYGAADLIGNVWEWTSNWYYPGHRLIEPPDPQGPTRQESVSANHPGVPVRVIKGGSYLCAESYCLRFRPAARQAQETGHGASHIGFRTVRNRVETD